MCIKLSINIFIAKSFKLYTINQCNRVNINWAGGPYNNWSEGPYKRITYPSVQAHI